MPVKLQHRRDASGTWSVANPILAAGEIGVETDTLKFKAGDGTTAWNSLPYRGAQGAQGYLGAQGANGTNITNSTQWTQGTNIQSTSSYQISSYDYGYFQVNYGMGIGTGGGVEMSAGGLSPLYVTIPMDISLGYPTGYGQTVTVYRTGLQTVTIQGASGVTIQAAQGVGQISPTTTPKLRTYGSAATCMRVADNRWYVFGDIIN
jgi:hypothetical protein